MSTSAFGVVHKADRGDGRDHGVRNAALAAGVVGAGLVTHHTLAAAGQGLGHANALKAVRAGARSADRSNLKNATLGLATSYGARVMSHDRPLTRMADDLAAVRHGTRRVGRAVASPVTSTRRARANHKTVRAFSEELKRVHNPGDMET